jgi:CBS domain-containing protein
MLFPIEKLLEGRGAPCCVSADKTVGDALTLMVEHDFSQLPIVDGDGKLCGIITEATINRTYYHVGGSISLLGLPVTHCQTKPATITPDSDIFEALDLLESEYAVIVVEGDKPVGILTDYDTTHFFRDISEGLILVEDIEVTLRQYIESAFPSEKEMREAMKRALGQRTDFERLSFWQHMQLVTAEGNWDKFRPVFESKELFSLLLDQVRHIRNQLAHFRGRPDLVQHDALLRAKDWLAARPKLSPPHAEQPIQVRVSYSVNIADQVAASQRPPRKYAPLANYLAQLKGESRIAMRFAQIESELDVELPASARTHRSWWANDQTSHVQSLAWMSAGWRVDDVDLSAETVVFGKTISALQQLFFADLLQRLKEARPGLTRATKTQPQSWWAFSGGKVGFRFVWVFNKENELQVELYIDTGTKDENKAAYDAFWEQRQEIETEIGHALKWERLDRRRASRISLARPGTVADPPEEQEQVKQWALETMLKFVDAFQPRIRELQ